MKKFIFKILLLSLIPLVSIITIDIFLRNINSLSSEKYNGLLKAKDAVTVLFLGSSHACYAIDPCEFEDFTAYNLANVSQKLYFDKRLTVKAINEGVANLKYVFISIDYHSLDTSTQGIRDFWTYYANGIKYKDKDYRKANISPFIWGYTPKVSLSLVLKTIIRKIKYKKNSVVNFDVGSGVNKTDTLCNGYIGYEGSNESSFNKYSYKSKARYFLRDMQTNERQEILEDLMSFIAFLKSKNIEPILFSTPTFTDYNKFLDSIAINQNRADINSICLKYNVEYWRFTEDSRFLKEDFYDQDHLNKIGAKKLSIILDEKLKKKVQETDSRRFD